MATEPGVGVPPPSAAVQSRLPISLRRRQLLGVRHAPIRVPSLRGGQPRVRRSPPPHRPPTALVSETARSRRASTCRKFDLVSKKNRRHISGLLSLPLLTEGVKKPIVQDQLILVPARGEPDAATSGSARPSCLKTKTPCSSSVCSANPGTEPRTHEPPNRSA